MKYLFILNLFFIGCVTKKEIIPLKPKGTCVRIIPKGREVIVPCN